MATAATSSTTSPTALSATSSTISSTSTITPIVSPDITTTSSDDITSQSTHSQPICPNPICPQSLASPPPLPLPPGYTFDTNYPDDAAELANFLARENVTAHGSTVYVAKDTIERLRRYRSYVVLLRDHNNVITGCIFSLPVPVRVHTVHTHTVQTRIVEHGCTTYLCLSKNLRGQGVARALMRHMMIHGHAHDTLCGYHIVPSRLTPQDVDIRAWYRPVCVKNVRQAGFTVPSLRQAHDRSDFRERLHYKITLPTDLDVTRITFENAWPALEAYRRLVSTKRMVYWPELTQWLDWTDSFPTYMVVTTTGDIVGMFSLAPLLFSTPSNRSLLRGHLVAWLVSQPSHKHHVISSCIFAASASLFEFTPDIIYGYVTGDIDTTMLSTVKANLTGSPVYVSMYNNSTPITATDITVPLL